MKPAGIIRPEQDELLRRMAAAMVVYTLGGALIAVPFGWKAVAGVLAGGGLMTANFVWVGRLVREVITGQSSARSFALKTAVKVLALYAAVTAVIWFGRVNVIAFLVGLSSVVVSIAVVGLAGWKNPAAKEEERPAGEVSDSRGE